MIFQVVLTGITEEEVSLLQKSIPCDLKLRPQTETKKIYLCNRSESNASLQRYSSYDICLLNRSNENIELTDNSKCDILLPSGYQYGDLTLKELRKSCVYSGSWDAAITCELLTNAPFPMNGESYLTLEGSIGLLYSKADIILANANLGVFKTIASISAALSIAVVDNSSYIKASGDMRLNRRISGAGVAFDLNATLGGEKRVSTMTGKQELVLYYEHRNGEFVSIVTIRECDISDCIFSILGAQHTIVSTCGDYALLADSTAEVAISRSTRHYDFDSIKISAMDNKTLRELDYVSFS